MQNTKFKPIKRPETRQIPNFEYCNNNGMSCSACNQCDKSGSVFGAFCRKRKILLWISDSMVRAHVQAMHTRTSKPNQLPLFKHLGPLKSNSK